MGVSADIVAIAEAVAGHTVAGRRVAEEEVARTLGARHMVAEAVAAARRNPLAVAAGSIGRVEVRRRRVEEEAGLHMAGEMVHRKVEGVVARSPGEVEGAAGSIGPEREVQAHRTAAEEEVAGSTPLAVGEAALLLVSQCQGRCARAATPCSNTHDHKVGTRNKTSRGNALGVAGRKILARRLREVFG
jgi:hypothetical protein